MKRENAFRQPALERWIGAQPDGLLHARPAIPAATSKRRRGPEPCEDDPDEIRICLGCGLPDCIVDKHGECRRLNEILRKIKKEAKKENEGL